MKKTLLGTALAISVVGGCGGHHKPRTTPEEAAAEVSVSRPKVKAPSPEEQEKAKQKAELDAERTKMRAEHEAEVARFTPELHAEAKKLAEKAYPSTKAGLKVILKSNTRKPGDAERDQYRHPAETLEFLGVKPNMTVLEVGPGEGWYTELLAPLLAAKGKLICSNSDPNGPPDARSTFYGERFKLFTETSPELYGKVETVVVDGKAPQLPMEGTLDEVLLFRGMHGMVNQGTLTAWLEQMHKALKPKGVLGIEQHRAADGADAAESAKKGYLPQAWVIEQVEAAGFKLAGKSEINANPKDTKDYEGGVWTLPPTLEKGDVDKDKYLAIGESDRMTLKFVKVAKKAAAPVNETPKKEAAKKEEGPQEKPIAAPTAN
jgi:predicted methyltransferase